MDSRAASIGFVNEGCSPWLRLRGGAAFQQKQFQNGGKGVESARVPLTIEIIFSLKIPGRIHPGSTLEMVLVATRKVKKACAYSPLVHALWEVRSRLSEDADEVDGFVLWDLVDALHRFSLCANLDAD
jgi:hypothetical protein